MLTIVQPTLFDEDEPVVVDRLPRFGRVLRTRGNGWMTVISGQWGWVFYRNVTGHGWESWEPSLPYGVAHVLDKDEAVTILVNLAATYGDDPDWLTRAPRYKTA